MDALENVMEYETVVLEMDDGSEVEFAIIEDFLMDGKKYVLLAAIDGDVLSEDPEDMIFMLDETDDTCEEDAIILTVIDSEEEYEKVVDFYTSLD